MRFQAGILGKALHDLVVLRLAGWPKEDASLLRHYWAQLAAEGEESGLPATGDVQLLMQSCAQQMLIADHADPKAV